MKKLLTLMESLPGNLDGAIVSSSVNRLYYTEFPSSAGTLVVTREQSYLIIDARYFEAAAERAKNCTVILQKNVSNQLKELLKKHKVKNVGIENDRLTVSELAVLEKNLSSFKVVSDSTLSDQINQQRAIKCETEKGFIQASQDITDQTFDYALSIIAPGRSEKEIALDMEFFSRKQGSDEAAFSFIVASGANTSRPHAVPTDKKITKGELLLMDFGSTFNGYRSDMTRTVAVGQPSDKMSDVYNTVLAAQLKAMELIKAGVQYHLVHKAAEAIINDSPYSGRFTHGLGHSFGLEIHEAPRFNSAPQGSASAGNVLSVEPGIYLPGEFGVRIEDIVFITDEGFHNFTHSRKELIVL